MSADSGELVAAGGVRGAAVDAVLDAAGFAVRAAPEATLERIYLDTFDGLLHHDGLILRWERGRLELLADGVSQPRATVALAQAPGELAVSEIPPGGLRDLVAGVVELRALLPLAHVRVVSRAVAVLDELDKTVARFLVEVPALVGLGTRERPLRTRVRPLAVRGYDRELADARSVVTRELELSGADTTLFEEAVRAAGRRPEGVGAKVDVALAADERADVAVVAILTRLLEIMDAMLPGTLRDTDSEFLHDYRVAIRRSRSVQREFKGVFPPGELGLMRSEFKWLQQVTGDSRDLDVYNLEFESMRALVPSDAQSDLDPLLALLRNRRLVARRQMVAALQSGRASSLRAEWAGLLAGLAGMPAADRPDAGAPIGRLSAARIRKVYGRMVRMGRAIGAASPPEDYHELRKKGKELRYLLELFGQPLHDPRVVKPMIKALKGLQDVLGHHQDLMVQIAMLGGMRDEVAAVRGGPSALMAMGVLVDRLEAEAEAARGKFAKAFSAFSSAEQRRRVESTFSAS